MIGRHAGDDEIARRRALLEANEELLAAAREFGRLVCDPEKLWVELEEVARLLDEKALAYSQARRAWGECEWLVRKVRTAPGASVKAEDFTQAAGALYEAVETLAELTSERLPASARDAARTVVGKAATRFYVAGCGVVDYELQLRGLGTARDRFFVEED